MRKLTLILLVVGLVAGAGWLHSPAHAQDRAGQIIAMVNSMRAANGLPGYAVDGALMAAAQAHASWMANTGQYGHTGEGGSSPQNRADASGYNGYVMENYVLGTGMSPSEAITWWDNSPIHHRTMLASGYTHVGAGTAIRERMIIYVLVVGKPRNAPAPSGSGGAPEPEEPEPVRIVVPVTRAEPREDGSIVHVVQQGQTLWDIAAVYEVDLGEMLWINNKKVGDIVKPGDEIIVRLAEGQLPPPTPTPPNFHTVQEGDSLWGIAAQYQIDFEQMLLINGMEVGDIVKPGDEIILFLRPGETPPPTPTPPLYHTVRAGQTVWEIAVANGLTVDELLALNNMQRPAIIKEGDELLIRAIDLTPTPTPTPEPDTAPTTGPTSTPESDTASMSAPEPSAPTMPPAPTTPPDTPSAPAPNTVPPAENPSAGAEMDAAPAVTNTSTNAPHMLTPSATTAASPQPSSIRVTTSPTATGMREGGAAAVVPSQTTTPRPTQAVSAVTNTAAASTNADDENNPGLILGLIAAGIILLAGLAIGIAIYYLK